jgi:hypothetical protein
LTQGKSGRVMTIGGSMRMKMAKNAEPASQRLR